MRVQRVQHTHTKQLRAPLTTTLRHPKSMQCNFNSCSFNYKSDYNILLVPSNFDYLSLRMKREEAKKEWKYCLVFV